MTFLQPLLLAALPLVFLPLVIHLVNQRRFQTVSWGAMRFLLAARAMSRGASRLRHWLIMALRMLAVAAVILAVARPLSRGWLALAGGARPDTAIVILDRSPSMAERGPAAAAGKLDTGRRQLAESLATLAAGRCVLLTSSTRPPVELADPAALTALPQATATAAPSDIPGLLRAAGEFVQADGVGTAEVWICSDQRANDWAPDTGGWAGIRDAWARLPQQVRVQLVSYPAAAPGNVAIRVTSARVEERADGHELVLSVAAVRSDGGAARTLPVTVEIGGVASTVDLELAGPEGVLENHAIPIDRGAGPRGFGRVSIPADANPADNDFYFAFAEPPVRRTLVVTADAGESPDEKAAARGVALAAEIPPRKDQEAAVDVVAAGGLAAAAWEETALVLWHADLPTDGEARLLEDFLARGGQVVFFPPDAPSARRFAGFGWTDWQTLPQPARPSAWRTDEDLLANTRAGTALPVGEIEVARVCGVAGEHGPLATLPGGQPLVGRLAGDGRSGCYFVATTASSRDSALADEGIVLYALVQRAIDRGAAALGRARQLDAGAAAAAVLGVGDWRRVAGPADAPSTDPGLHAGVFARDDRLVAVNRPAAEDAARVVADARIDALFQGLPFGRLVGRAGHTESLVQEIWRALLIAMLLALVAEGLLCLPRRPQPAAPAGARPPLEAAA
jgi:hypothetical protein